ncbi:MAG: hypothetical protein ACRD6W_16275, partial [Nitrososphaerales archaeon]
PLYAVDVPRTPARGWCQSGEVDIDVLFASAAVSDLGRAQEWYERFFDRPPDIVPNEHEVMWKATDSA